MNRTGAPGPAPDPDLYFGQPIIPVIVLTIIASTLLISLRYWSRAVILRTIALEDAFIFLAWLFAVGTSLCNAIALNYGLGRQYAVLDDETRVKNLKTSFATNVIYAFALFFVKVSILCLYIRVLTYNSVRRAAKVLLVVVTITHAWIIASLFTGCIPLAGLWDKVTHEKRYCHPGSVYYSHSSINIATDFLIFLLPLTVLHRIHAPPKQKIALYFVFLLAFCVCVISVIRLILLYNIRFINTRKDVSMNGVIVAILNMLEVHTAVVCACITTIKPVLARFFPRVFSSNLAGGGSGTSTGESEAWSSELERARRCRRPQHPDDQLIYDGNGALATVDDKAEDPSHEEATGR
ncbi:hypothetical protein VTH82DRAFT_5347 [Thermothelomyces myriococcoides]